MRPCFMRLLLRCGVALLPESVWNGAGMSHASNPSEVLSIDNTLYPNQYTPGAGAGDAQPLAGVWPHLG
jgi:hypothetical protein